MKGYDEDLQSFNNNISEHSINLNIDSDIEPQTISLSDKELLGKEKKMNLNDRSGLEDTLFKEITNEVKDDIDAGTIKEISSDLRLKDVNFNLTELNYKINSTKFLPVQLIEFTDKKGKNIIKLLDFINKKIIKV
tara:strand:- start:510 stop:914 length:405 start_codon:yes stop_codon:yes gene_type:complete